MLPMSSSSSSRRTPIPFPSIFLFHLFSFLFSTFADQNPSTCSSSSSPFCLPFRSPPTFPFSVVPGCGHPSFQIRCDADTNPNVSTIVINSVSYNIVRLLNNSNNLVISPSDLHSSVSHFFFPKSPIDLSLSPFQFTHSTCYRLSSLPRCSSITSNRASTRKITAGTSKKPSFWQRDLLKDPVLLLKGCQRQSDGNRYGDDEDHGDVVDAILNFLKSGIEVSWNPSFDPYFSNCSDCRRNSTLNSCGFNASDPSKRFFCYPPLFSSSSSSSDDQRPSIRQPNRAILIGTTLFVFACLVILVISVATAFRRGNGSLTAADGGSGGSSSESMVRAFLRRHQFHIRSPVYSYEQLRASTDGFDSKRKIGDGGFGSVYLAHLEDGSVAAVKRLHRHHPSTTKNKSFCNEIFILSSIHHPNLVRLHGYCCDPRGLLLVYDYVPNGTLADHLHGSRGIYNKPPLTWPVRVDIAVQIASALEYLHFSVKPPVVHRDITSTNIFLEKDMRIKVGDFGLSRLLSLPPRDSSQLTVRAGSSSSQCVWTGPQGTPGYLDPDYHHSFWLTEKSDVYSFGVVLLELITGMKAVDVKRDKREVGLADMVVSKIQVGELHKVVDPMLVCQGHVMGTVESIAELAFRCLAADKDDRPDSRELVEELRRIRCRTQEAHS